MKELVKMADEIDNDLAYLAHQLAEISQRTYMLVKKLEDITGEQGSNE